MSHYYVLILLYQVPVPGTGRAYRINRADVLISLYQVEDVPGRSCRINRANIMDEYLVPGTLYVVTGMIDCIMPDWYWY